MNKARRIIISIIFIGLGVGCGEDTASKKPEPDRIEKVGDAASTLGYDGEQIKEDLRGLNDLKKKQEEEMQEVLDNY